jgi:GNAT superfamily N-acetyltransferase
MEGMSEPVTAAELRILPANQATWQDLVAIFGTADYPYHCQCQRLKVSGWLWRDTSLEERLAMHQASTACGQPHADHTSGLVAYLEDEPVGWVAVEPRITYPKLRTLRVPWTGRDEDKDDDGVWAVTCFCVRKGCRGRGITYPLARAAADHARGRGATAVEGYPMVTEPGREITWGEVHVGAVQVFDEAGFTAVSAPTKRRRVMRIDF